MLSVNCNDVLATALGEYFPLPAIHEFLKSIHTSRLQY
jgi:hypothetical protein